MNQTRRVLVSSPDLEDGISWWRSWGPWCRVAQEVHGVDLLRCDLRINPGATWTDVEYADMGFINRPYEPGHGHLIMALAEHGRPTIVDFDDHLWDVPTGNKAVVYYTPDKQEVSSRSAEHASELTVSTEFLQRYIKNRIAPDSTITIMPNVLPDHYRWNTLEREKLILWRGGLSHIADIATVAEGIAKFAKDNPDWRFVFIGCDPWPVTKLMNKDQYKATHVIPLPMFHRLLGNRSPRVMIVPLEDCEFNHAKSNISWMEGTYSGARVVAPDFHEFRQPGVVNYKNPEEFAECLQRAVDEDSEPHVRASRQKIDDCLRGRHQVKILSGVMDRWAPLE